MISPIAHGDGNLGVLIITHYSRILRYMRPDKVHVMLDGRIVRSGGPEVAEDLEAQGYDVLRRELGLTVGVLGLPFVLGHAAV